MATWRGSPLMMAGPTWRALDLSVADRESVFLCSAPSAKVVGGLGGRRGERLDVGGYQGGVGQVERGWSMGWQQMLRTYRPCCAAASGERGARQGRKPCGRTRRNVLLAQEVGRGDCDGGRGLAVVIGT